jgi:hypothetical protein
MTTTPPPDIDPTAFGGRIIPDIDWEGDDHRLPATADQFVTCGDSSIAMAAAWASDGRIIHDGSVYRASDPAPGGVDFPHLAVELQKVAGLKLIVPTGWTWGNCSWNLMQGTGLVVMGKYSALVEPYREQVAADFLHFIFLCYRSITSGVRLLDPLNKNVASQGKWVPAPVVRAFIESATGLYGRSGVQVAYINNQPLLPAGH